MATAKLWWNGSSWVTSSAYCVNEKIDGNMQLGVKHMIQIVAYDDATIKMNQAFQAYQTASIYFSVNMTNSPVTVKSGSTTIGSSSFTNKDVTNYSSFSYSGTAAANGVENYTTHQSGNIPFSGNIPSSGTLPNPFKTITYNANGGSGAPASKTTTPGTVTLSTTKPTRTGYSFLGWSTSPSATSASYSAGGSFNLTANTTLYAVWKANTYTLTKSIPSTASVTIKKNGSAYTGTSIAYDDVLTITFSPKAGYYIQSAKLNGTTISSGATHTVRSNVSIVITTVAAYSTINTYDSSVSTNGTFHLSVTRYSTAHYNICRYYDSSNRLLYTSPVFTDSTTVSVPRSWFNNYGSVTSMTVKVVNTTYTDPNGTTQTGLTEQKTFTVTADSGMKPTLASGCITLTPYNTGTGAANLTDNLYIKSYSKVKAVFDTTKITHAEGASAATYAISVQNVATFGSGTTLTSSNKLTSAGSLTITYTVTDSRGRSSSGTQTIVVNDYSNPLISSLVCNRTDSSGIIDENDSYMTVTAVANFTAVSNNAVTLEAFVKPLGGSYTSYGNIQNAIAETFGGAFQPDTSYVVKITVTDTVGNSSYLEINMPRRNWIFHMRQSANGPGAAFGKVTENDYALQLASGWKLLMDDLPMTKANLQAFFDYASQISAKVDKSGDTMTGGLTIQTSGSGGLYLKNTAMEIGVTPSSSLYKYINFKDKNDNDVGVIYSRINTSGNAALRVGAHVGSTYNTVTFTINPSTSATGISFDDVAAWLTALGLGTSGALPITIAQGGTGQTAVSTVTTVSTVATAATGYTVDSVSFKKWGKLAQLVIYVTRTGDAITSSTNVTCCTLKSGYRPAIECAAVCPAASTTFAHIGDNGTVHLEGTWGKNTQKRVLATFLLA